MKFFKLLISLCALTMLTVSVAGKEWVPLIDTTTGEIEITPPQTFIEKLWTVRPLEDVKIEYPGSKTPTGKPVVSVSFLTDRQAGKIRRATAPLLKNKKGEWRKRSYSALSLWIKGDGSGKTLMLYASIGGLRRVWHIKLNKKKWEKVILPIKRAYHRDGQKAELSKLTVLSFASNEKISFAAGDFRLIPAAETVPFKRMMSLEIPIIPSPENKNLFKDKKIFGQALHIKSFVKTTSHEKASETTDVKIFADNEKLYLKAKMNDADTSKMRASLEKRDLGVWQDDCFELLTDETLNGKAYRHIIVNSIGTIQDYRRHYDVVKEMFLNDSGWNPDFYIRNEILPQVWNLDMAVPLSALKLQKDKPFALQMGRENHEIREYSSLAETMKFTNTGYFAIAVLGKSEIKTDKIKLKKKTRKEYLISGNFPEQGEFELNIFIAGPYGKDSESICSGKTDKAGHFVLPIKIKAPSEGQFRMTLWGKVNDKKISPEALSFYMALPPEVKFGDLVLNPKPKEITRGKEKFSFNKLIPIKIPEKASARTRKTARFLRSEIHKNMFGIFPALRTGFNNSKLEFRLALKENTASLVKDIDKKKKIEKLPPEGYYLKTGKDGVTIIGADEAGLYYGVVTLRQIARGKAVKKHEPSLNEIEIFDWPDLNYRMISYWNRPYRRPKEPIMDTGLVKNYLKEFVAGNKLNCFGLLIDKAFEFDHYAELTKLGSLSLEDYKEIASFASEHFINFIPAFQSGGHSAYLVKTWPELQEKGYDKDQVNVLHKKWTDIQFKCYEDIIRATPKSKFFYIWHDEWWHHPRSKVTDELNGKKRWKVFADEVTKIRNFFAARGKRIMMCSDMLAPNHNGGYPFFISKALDEIPEDIILLNWGVGTAPDAAKVFHNKGFEVWDLFNQFKVPPAGDVNIIKGFGGTQYGHFYQTFWYSRDWVLPDYTHAVFRTAKYGWNMRSDCQLPLGEWRRRYLNNILSIYNFPERKITSYKKFIPVDIATLANVKEDEWFGEPDKAPQLEKGRRNIAFIPMNINKGDKLALATAPEGGEQVIPLERRGVKSLFFLQGLYLNKEKRKDFKKRSSKYMYGVPCAEIRIEYTDGPTEIIPIRAGIETNEITPFWNSRYMFGCRYTLETDTKDKTRAALYMLEWENPYRFRTIKNIVWKSYGTEAIPVLFAVTAGF